MAFYGSRGTIHVDKGYCQRALHLWQEGDASFREVPADILACLPPVERRANWRVGWEMPQREGRGQQPYLTIEDGWRHRDVTDAVRGADGWTNLPAEP